jgi:hypothetical protein
MRFLSHPHRSVISRYVKTVPIFRTAERAWGAIKYKETWRPGSTRFLLCNLSHLSTTATERIDLPLWEFSRCSQSNTSHEMRHEGSENPALLDLANIGIQCDSSNTTLHQRLNKGNYQCYGLYL